MSEPATVVVPPNPTPAWIKPAASFAVVFIGALLGSLSNGCQPKPAPVVDPAPVLIEEAKPESWIIKDDTGRRTLDKSVEQIAAALKPGKWIAEGIPKPGEVGVNLSIEISDGKPPVVDPTPIPTPEPPVVDPPKPPAPVVIPSTDFRVLIIEEKDDRQSIPPTQLEVLFSTKIRDYLNSHCAKVGDVPEWRMFDKDQVLSAESPAWNQIFTEAKKALPKLPAIVIINGTKGQSFELPSTEDATLELLKKYGGA